MIGIYEKALSDNLGWEEKLLIASDCGYDFMEISIDESDKRLNRLYWNKEEKDSLKAAISKTGLPISSMCLSAHRRYPLGSEDLKTQEKSLEIMEKAIEFALDVGVKVIQLAGYDVYYEEGNDTTKEIFIKNLGKAIAMAEKANIKLAIENMDHHFINSIQDIMEYINIYKSPFLQSYPDIGNLSAWDLDIVEELKICKEHILGIHLKDTLKNVFRRVNFGDGNVDFDRAFEYFYSINYKGPFVIEMWADEKEDNIETIKNARDWIRAKMAMAGYEFN